MRAGDPLTTITERQHGAVSRHQLATAGLDGAARRQRVRSGHLRAVSRDVFVVPGSPDTWRQRLMCAVLEAGSEAVAACSSAAALLGVPGFPEGSVEVLRRRSHDHHVRLGRLHETSWLPPNHVTVVDGIPCTTLARTIFDLAGTEKPGRVERALDNALSQLGLTIDRQAEVLAVMGKRGRPGTALMRRLLDDRAPGYVPPASELEALFLSLVRSAGLPEPEKQLTAGGAELVGRVDAAYPKARLIVELDSRRHHTSLLDWEADRRRDNALMAVGWRVLRVTWRQLVHEPRRVAGLLREALEAAA